MPILAFGGRDRMSEHVADALRDHADLVVGKVAPTGHFIAEEAPEWVVDTLEDFLRLRAR